MCRVICHKENIASAPLTAKRSEMSLRRLDVAPAHPVLADIAPLKKSLATVEIFKETLAAQAPRLRAPEMRAPAPHNLAWKDIFRPRLKNA